MQDISHTFAQELRGSLHLGILGVGKFKLGGDHN
ncbi:MAG: hypothetical protein JWO89_1634, partial [Verrucomicrobiaceae bacterium]|nr:hypothetical protein [Verrucomicrobiaceae bacterium]